MSRARLAALLFCGTLALAVNPIVYGQNYPIKAIRLVTSPPGAGGDLLARIIAQNISGPLGQSVIVDNRSVGVIQGEIVSKSPADGYTMLLEAGDFWIGPFLEKTPYDPVKDFAPLTTVAASPNILAVNLSLPVKSVKELIALAKAKPGTLNYGSAAAGSPNHIATELFRVMAGVNIVRVPYKGVGPALVGLMGGEVQLMFANAAAMMPQVKAGTVRALAVTSAQPSMLAPGLPTVAADLPGYEAASIYGMFVPAHTPAAVISRLNREIVTALNKPDVKEKLLSAGIEVIASSPEQLATTMKSEMAKWGKLMKDAGIHED